ncbi:putative quinol monooxygenase [Pulveribacter suum]|uniref:Antibiotic biosynthesis monooxygenase n=1 Tax=Pulveribacter suum TaxID=2116657 RepID=A0A2P1NPA1_9BURK|nr:putative quinol monooxygenase [Pulveribacter suum]AVP58885.1 antibiotic biosynthesis monooxygenase [Pulveribacter suum]
MATAKNQVPVQKLVRLTAKPGRQAELRTALQVLESATCAEPGCIEFTLLQSISDDEQFVLLEHFVDDEAFKLNMQLPHTQAFFNAQLVASVHATDVTGLVCP